MKNINLQRLKPGVVAGSLALLILTVAFCKPLVANPLEEIENDILRQYTTAELQRGAWSLQVPARVLYREALEALESGNREKAEQKLLLAARLSGDYPDPMFALAGIELRRGDSDCIIHLIEGFKRKARSFYGQALIAANTVILAVSVAIAVLFLTLLFLLIRHWPEYDHKLREIYGGRYAFPPARFIGPLIILGLLIARTGIAVYSALMVAVLWPVIGRKEKAAVLTLTLFICAASFFSPRLGTLTAALDEGGITRRLSLINERGADPQLIRSIGSIEDERFSAEREFALGTLKSRLGFYEEAKEHLLRSVSKRGDFAPAYLNLGNVYFRQGDFNKALAGYQSVVAIDSTSALAWFNIGQTYINKMLFAESSDALAKARDNGIEEYRLANPSTTLLDLDIYDCGFPDRELWKTAFKEGEIGGAGVLDGIFRPYTLFPLRMLWILLAAAVAAGIILARAVPASWNVFSCHNCGLPTCPDCCDSETGIELCHNCAAAIGGLSSVKVMEALLRHRRQKVRSMRSRGGWLKMRVVPGSSKIITGAVWSGMFTISVVVSALLLILWQGFYLHDPRSAETEATLMQQAAAAAVILLCWLSTLRSKQKREQINYRILPPDYRVQPPPEKKAPELKIKEEAPRRLSEQDSKAQEAFKEYLESL